MGICIPFGYLNLDDNMWFQWVSVVGLIVFTAEFFGQFIYNMANNDKDNTSYMYVNCPTGIPTCRPTTPPPAHRPARIPPADPPAHQVRADHYADYHPADQRDMCGVSYLELFHCMVSSYSLSRSSLLPQHTL